MCALQKKKSKIRNDYSLFTHLHYVPLDNGYLMDAREILFTKKSIGICFSSAPTKHKPNAQKWVEISVAIPHNFFQEIVLFRLTWCADRDRSIHIPFHGDGEHCSTVVNSGILKIFQIIFDPKYINCIPWTCTHFSKMRKFNWTGWRGFAMIADDN